ncbi:MAG: hypothetical protein Q9215_007229 [Flavoplaca cf. flavocitrina]
MTRTKQTRTNDGKKKKKNAPDRQQPEWMFPPDEENPVLNPKPKSEAQTAKDKKEWEDAIKFLKHRIHSAPMKPAPPKQLLTLVGAFLTSYGFHNTCRIYQLQCTARSKLHGWDSVLGEKLPKDFPDLVKLYKYGLQTYEEKQKLDETSSSDGEDKRAPKTNKRKRTKMEERAKKEKREAAKAKAAQTSSSGSDEDSDDTSDSDISMKDASASPQSAKDLTKSHSSTSPSSATSISESDADDENETAGLGASSRKPTTTQMLNPLKRKTPPSVSSSSDSSSGEEAPAPKKFKQDAIKSEKTDGATVPISTRNGNEQPSPKITQSDSSSSSSGSESTSNSSDNRHKEQILSNHTAPTDTPLPTATTASLSDSDSTSSESDSEDDLKVPKIQKLIDDSKVSSDSSVTLVPTPTMNFSKDNTNNPHGSTTSSSSSSSSGSESKRALTSQEPTSTDATISTKKRKASASPHAVAQSTAVTVHEELSPSMGNTTSITTTTTSKKEPKPRAVPFTRISPNTPIPASLASNAYQPYDYAERAHQDLIITKGKGFTKEKNKKKRGSYRGGVIDVGPGRAIRFDD